MALTTKQTRQAIAERLRTALGPRTLRWLAAQLRVAAQRDPDLRGVTVAGLRNYLEGTRSAPVELLGAIAEVLGVNAAWLATGQGSGPGGVAVTVTPPGFGLTAVLGVPVKPSPPLPAGETVSVWEDVFRRADPIFAALNREQRRAALLFAERAITLRGAPLSHANLTATARALAGAMRTPGVLTGTGDPHESLDAWGLDRYLEVFLASMRLGIPRVEAGPRGRPAGTSRSSQSAPTKGRRGK